MQLVKNSQLPKTYAAYGIPYFQSLIPVFFYICNTNYMTSLFRLFEGYIGSFGLEHAVNTPGCPNRTVASKIGYFSFKVQKIARGPLVSPFSTFPKPTTFTVGSTMPSLPTKKRAFNPLTLKPHHGTWLKRLALLAIGIHKVRQNRNTKGLRITFEFFHLVHVIKVIPQFWRWKLGRVVQTTNLQKRKVAPWLWKECFLRLA